jgi:hypothetical protein
VTIASSVAPWQAHLVATLKELGRRTDGRYDPEPARDLEVVDAERYLDRPFLREAVARAGSTQAPPSRSDGDHGFTDEAEPDLRIAVSRFTRHAASLSAAAFAALGRGVGLDVSASNVRFVMRGNVPFIASLRPGGTPPLRCRERPAAWPIEGPMVDTVDELRVFVWRKLYAEHLAPLFARALELTRVSPRLMWSNAAEWVAIVSDAADEYLGPPRADPFVADRIALLGATSLPGLAGENPMQDLIAWDALDAPDFPHGVGRRRICCLTYMLEDRLGRLCGNCPFLSQDERIAMVREEHGVPMGAPGGPAQARAILVGRRKLGL